MSAEYFNDQWRIPNNKNQSLVSNYSMEFNGINDFVDASVASSDVVPSRQSSWTYSSWLYLNSTHTSYQCIFERGAAYPGNGMLVRENAGTIQVYAAATVVIFTSNLLPTDEWAHFALVYDISTNELTCYINNSSQTLTMPAGWAISGTLFYIGKRQNNINFWTGKMDQVSVFDYALPATGTNSVATLYGGGTAVTNPMSLSPTPVTYYQLGDQSVSTGPTSDYLVPNNSLQDYVFDFDSTNNEYIDCGGANDFSFTNGSGTDLPFSLSAWINMVDASSFRIISKYGSGTDIEWYFYTTGSDILRFRLYDKNNVGYIGRGYSTAMTSYQGQWINVVATYNGNEQSSGIKIYINGLKVDDQDASGGTYEGMTTTTNPVTIGKMGTAYANGKFSNVSIFNTELISTQVETIYNNGAPNDISSLNPAAWYKLNASEIFNNTSTEWSVDNNAYPSVYQSSLNFGTSDYINTNRTVASNLNFSVSAWINPTSHDTVILGTRGLATASTSNGFTMNINSSGNLWGRIFTETSNVTQVQTGGTISLNNWSHVAMTYNSSSKTLKTYLNGSEVGSIIGTDSSVTSTAELNIGRASIGTFYDYFDGEISNTAVFNTELTSNQITTIYNNGTPEAAISHSPTSWYKLNNTTTGIQDSAGSNNGTNNGATEYAGFVNTLAGESVSMDSSNLVVSDLQQTSGYSPYALDFDGVDDYLDFNNASANIMAGKNAISISGWFKLNSNSTSSAVFSNWYGSSVQYLLRYNATIGFGIQWYVNSNAASTIINTGYVPNVGDWVHVVGVKDPITNGGQSRVYINGFEAVSQDSGNLSTPLANIIRDDQIGVFSNSSNRMNGSISNVAYWTDTALTQAQVTEIYNQGVPSNLNNFSGTAPAHWLQIGTNSSFNATTSQWTCLDEIGNINAVSAGMTNDDITNGPGYSANGLGTSSIDIKGDAPYSSANGLSENMDVLDRTTDVPS